LGEEGKPVLDGRALAAYDAICEGGIGVRRGIIVVGLAAGFFFAVGIAAAAQGEYDWPQAAEESYWYAVYNIRALVTSGMGLSPADDEILNQLVEQAGLPKELIIAPYASGDPTYVQSGSFKWNPQRRDPTVTTEALAWMVISLATQAKQLERLYQTGIASDDETRGRAMLYGFLASEAARFARERLLDPQTGLYVRSWREEGRAGERDFNPLDQFLMLWAWAELNSLAEGFSFYRGAVPHILGELWAEELFRAIGRYGEDHPRWLAFSPYERGLAIEAVSAYAATLESGPLLEEAVRFVRLETRVLAEQVDKLSKLAELAEAARALMVAQLLLGDPSLRKKALRIWQDLQGLWDDDVGVYKNDPESSVYDYTLQDLGAVVGAFGAVIYGAGLEGAKARYARFFQNALKISRLMIAEGEEAGGDDDGDEVPGPERAIGPFGSAPVFKGGVQYDLSTSDWYDKDSRFQTAGALQLATRLMWLGQRGGQPFSGPPRYGLPLSRDAQLIGLRMQLTELSEAELKALKSLLESLEGRFEEQKRYVQGLEGRLGVELESLKRRVDTLSSRISRPKGGKVTLTDTVSVLLIILVLLVGFIAYQWAAQRYI